MTSFNSLDTEYFSNEGIAKVLAARSSDEISCVYLNIRSLVSNFSNLHVYLSNFHVKPDIIALSETKITEKVNLNPHVDIPGYTFEHRKSKSHFGGFFPYPG